MTDVDAFLSDALPSFSPAVPGRWWRVRDADVDGVESYRSTALAVPAGRQEGFTLRRDGKFEFFDIPVGGVEVGGVEVGGVEVGGVEVGGVEVGGVEVGDPGTVTAWGRWSHPTPDRLALDFDDSSRAAILLQLVADIGIGDHGFRARRITQPLPTISPAVPGRWARDPDVAAEGISVYRPAAPGHATETGVLEFGRDGSVLEDVADPAGVVRSRRGRWLQPTSDRLDVTFDERSIEFTLQVVGDVEIDLLHVRRLPELGFPLATTGQL